MVVFTTGAIAFISFFLPNILCDAQYILRRTEKSKKVKTRVGTKTKGMGWAGKVIRQSSSHGIGRD